MARSGSNYSSKSGARPYNLARMATENSAAALMNKPKLIRQTAILADGDSTGSGKSVTFQVQILEILNISIKYDLKARQKL